MQPKYVLQNQSTEETGQTLSITQGETLDVSLFFIAPSGIPLAIGSATECVVKLFSQINQASILKKLSLSQVELIQSDQLGIFGINFSIAAADSLMMAPNNCGLPMSAIFTQTDGEITQYDLLSAFIIMVPAVQT